MKNFIFIDGSAGTTGLEIKERLKNRDDLELMEIPHQDRKNPEVKKKYFQKADITVLCLPDAAARESAALADGLTRILDASTAHRTNPSWCYGFPELKPDFRKKIRKASKVANPGCYATGFISIIKPLIDCDIVSNDAPFMLHAVSGYSGAGKPLIETYRAHEQKAKENDISEKLFHYAPYKLDLKHKHLPEITEICGLKSQPVMVPAVDHYYRGMLVTVPLHKNIIKKKFFHKGDTELHKRLENIFRDYYRGERFISVSNYKADNLRDGNFLDFKKVNHTNRLEIIIGGTDHNAVIFARLDNLGKGASGAAVQNMNLMIGAPEDRGLT